MGEGSCEPAAALGLRFLTYEGSILHRGFDGRVGVNKEGKRKHT
jgi:hypothetical protein